MSVSFLGRGYKIKLPGNPEIWPLVVLLALPHTPADHASSSGLQKCIQTRDA